MAEKVRIAFELEGIDEIARTCEEIVEHLDAALRLMEQLQGEHTVVPRAVTRPAGERPPAAQPDGTEGRGD